MLKSKKPKITSEESIFGPDIRELAELMIRDGQIVCKNCNLNPYSIQDLTFALTILNTFLSTFNNKEKDNKSGLNIIEHET